MSILIRKCDWETDAKALLSFVPAEQVERIETLRRTPTGSVVLVASDYPHIAGWAVAHTARREDLGWFWDDDAVRSITDTNACLEHLYIHAKFRRQRVASELLTQMEQELQRAGKKAAYLHCATENTAAQRLYESSGWLVEKYVEPRWADGRNYMIYWKKLEDMRIL